MFIVFIYLFFMQKTLDSIVLSDLWIWPAISNTLIYVEVNWTLRTDGVIILYIWQLNYEPKTTEPHARYFSSNLYIHILSSSIRIITS